MHSRFVVIVVLAGLLIHFLQTPVVHAQSAGGSPNVVLVIADQMRGDALGALGHPNVRTPNLDRMASQGVLFENYFVNNPVCAPTRVSMVTGRYPHELGNFTNSVTEYVSSLEGTLMGYFKDRGYRLGYFGKNHAFEDSALAEMDEVNLRGREPFRNYSKYVPPYWHGDMYWPSEKLNASKTTIDGIRFIEAASSDRPFFMVLSYFDPHPPYFAPAPYAHRYPAEEMEIPPYIDPKQLSDRLAEQQRALHYDRVDLPELRGTLKYYYASIEWGVDYQVGQILEALESGDLSEDTIVIVTSEHGDFMGDHHMVRKGMFLYDALLRVPLIWYAPGRTAEGWRSQVMAQSVDLFPTLVDMTGGQVPENLPGRSLKPFLEGGREQGDEATVFASAAYSDLPPGYFDDPEPPFYDPPEDSDVPFHTRVQRLTWKPEQRTLMARTREWKLILNESRPPELYHMNGGWTERENVADDPQYQDVFDTLKARAQEVWSW